MGLLLLCLTFTLCKTPNISLVRVGVGVSIVLLLWDCAYLENGACHTSLYKHKWLNGSYCLNGVSVPLGYQEDHKMNGGNRNGLSFCRFRVWNQSVTPHTPEKDPSLPLASSERPRRSLASGSRTAVSLSVHGIPCPRFSSSSKGSGPGSWMTQPALVDPIFTNYTCSDPIPKEGRVLACWALVYQYIFLSVVHP